MSRFCRHNRLTVECPICSKDAMPAPVRSSGRKTRATTARSSAPAATAVRGPYASAGPYEGGSEVRLERVPGGLRLAEWHAGRIARRAPVLDASDLPGLLADAVGKGLLEARAGDGESAPSEYGSSPGRTGEMRDDLRVERVDGGRVRIARWILRPNAGWQLQEAPVMLPPGRFGEALAAAAAGGVLASGGTVDPSGPEDP
ncbi:MAG TPA: hypothetical protein VFQ12_04660 [Thermoleophilaceae bacterium]|nr:hypothetical protein [Thermoleophilaceae bacterium]